MAGYINFPSQTIPEKDKNDAWMALHLSYAQGLVRNQNNNRDRMTRLFNGYNGITNPKSMEYLTSTYGAANKAPYISYRVSKVKIDLLQGEWLKRPLISTVTTINSTSVSNKMQQFDFMKGAMAARDEIRAVKEIAGVDIMEGIDIPEDESAFAKMNFKEQTETLMQVIADKQIVHLDAKKKIGDAFLDCEITNHAHMMVELDEKGTVKLYKIDPRDAIYESIEGDDYLERSPIRGCRRLMPIHEVLLRYKLTKDQVATIETMRSNPSRYEGNGLSILNGELLCEVIHIEWDSVTPLYTKKVAKTNTQSFYDPSPDALSFPMDTVKYENNKAYHDKNVSDGKYDIVTKYIGEQYEATRIAGVIDVDMRKTQNKKRSIDRPSEILSRTYISYIHGRVNGVTVSLQQLIENFSNIYDLIQYKKNIELAKMKGKYMTIDRAGLGVNQTVKNTLHRLVNDQLVEYDSSAAGNLGGRQLDPSMMFKTGDLGLSDSFQQLLVAEQNIISNINQITGINENRQGITSASSTATAQQSDIANSRTITEALFYGFSGFTKRVVKAIVDKSAISYAFYKTEEGEDILGSEMYGYLKATIELAYRDYGVEVEDGSRYMEISQKIESMMQVSLNAKEIRPMDALNVLLAETVALKKSYLEASWAAMQASIQQSQQSEQESQAQMMQQQMATQIQIANDDREDRQLNSKDDITLKGQVQMEIDNNKANNDGKLQQDKMMGDIITKTQPPPMI